MPTYEIDGMSVMYPTPLVDVVGVIPRFPGSTLLVVLLDPSGARVGLELQRGAAETLVEKLSEVLRDASEQT